MSGPPLVLAQAEVEVGVELHLVVDGNSGSVRGSLDQLRLHPDHFLVWTGAERVEELETVAAARLPVGGGELGELQTGEGERLRAGVEVVDRAEASGGAQPG